MPTPQNPLFINTGTIINPPMQGNNLAGAYGNMPVTGMQNQQQSSMFMQPPGMPPGMQNNQGMPTMDFLPGMEQPFTQFVNGMPVQTITPSATPSPSITDHPCQGKGGSGCGCGGSCKTKTLSGCCGQNSNKTGKISLSQITPQSKPDWDIENPAMFLENFGGYLNLSEFYKTQPGNTSFMTCDYQNGKIETIVSNVNEDGSIISSVKNAVSADTDFTLFFPKVENGWQIIVNGKTLDSILPSTTPLDVINIMTWGVATAIKINNRLSEPGTIPETPAGIGPVDNPVCIIHDLVCSAMFGDNWPFTSDHKHITWWAPCVGAFQADISQCCLDHDINLWCHTGVFDIALFNAEVVACIIGTVLAKAYELVAKSDCDWLWKILCMAAISLWILASGLLAGILYEIIATLAVTIQNLFINSGFVGQGALLGSCLCGGNRSTVACSDPCRNLCHERGQDSTKCTWCTWKCINVPGKPKSVVLNKGQSPNLPCCQGSVSTMDRVSGIKCGQTMQDALNNC